MVRGDENGKEQTIEFSSVFSCISSSVRVTLDVRTVRKQLHTEGNDFASGHDDDDDGWEENGMFFEQRFFLDRNQEN